MVQGADPKPSKPSKPAKPGNSENPEIQEISEGCQEAEHEAGGRAPPPLPQAPLVVPVPQAYAQAPSPSAALQFLDVAQATPSLQRHADTPTASPTQVPRDVFIPRFESLMMPDHNIDPRLQSTGHAEEPSTSTSSAPQPSSSSSFAGPGQQPQLQHHQAHSLQQPQQQQHQHQHQHQQQDTSPHLQHKPHAHYQHLAQQEQPQQPKLQQHQQQQPLPPLAPPQQQAQQLHYHQQLQHEHQHPHQQQQQQLQQQHPPASHPQSYYLPTSTSPQQRGLPAATSSASPVGFETTDEQLTPTAETPDNDPSGIYNGSEDPHRAGIFGATPTADNANQPRPRSCDSCRGLKVKCERFNGPKLPCKRCTKTNRVCVTTPPQKKRQKKSDTRVTELERKIEALQSCIVEKTGMLPSYLARHVLVNHITGGSGSGHENPQLSGQTSRDDQSYPAQFPRQAPQGEGSFFGVVGHEWANDNGRTGVPVVEPVRTLPPIQTPQSLPMRNASVSASPRAERWNKRKRVGSTSERRAASPTSSIVEDMHAIHRDMAENPEPQRGKNRWVQQDHSDINRKIDDLLDHGTAEKILQRYKLQLCPHFPALPLPPDMTATQLREQKPLLYLAILASSSHGDTSLGVAQEVQRELSSLLKDQFADIIWRNGEKSLEIVQALQVSVLWYRPPMHYEQHNFYMMVNCATIMALDLGMGRKAAPHAIRVRTAPGPHEPNTSSVEARRTFLVCYYLCMNITMVLRRPILLRWTRYMDECVDILEQSPEAYSSDKILCHHVKVAHIGERISTAYEMDDPSSEISLFQPNVSYDMKNFENQLKLLQEQRSKDRLDADAAILLAENVTNLFMHELALHTTQAAAEFQPPYPFDAEGTMARDPLAPGRLEALEECLRAINGIFDTILNIELETLITLPVIFCVRAVYAVVCLMKLWFLVSSSPEVSKKIKKEDLNIEHYLNKLVTMFENIVKADAQSPHGKFYYVTQRLRTRFDLIKQNHNKDGPGLRRGQRATASSQGPRVPARSHGLRSSQQTSHQDSQGSATQTPLHVLSELAMESSGPSGAMSVSNPQAHPALMQHSQQHTQLSPSFTLGQQPQQQQYQQQGLTTTSTGQSWLLTPQLNVNAPVQEVTTFEPAMDNFTLDVANFNPSRASDADLNTLYHPDAIYGFDDSAWNLALDPSLWNYQYDVPK